MPSTETIQSSSTLSPRPPRARGRLLRLAGVGVTVVVTLAVWAVGRLAGADYVLRDPSGSVTIDAVATAVVTLWSPRSAGEFSPCWNDSPGMRSGSGSGWRRP